ncbi:MULTISPECIES: DUF6048 family protein [Candidatus Cardinium]|uniref:DUF6048 family protein n=1 Tax=Candidatus Cardinium TaxID=273135 RepID=UPI001FAA02AE|nr:MULTISPECIES: DUF6048 family protein [Cardinium]
MLRYITKPFFYIVFSVTIPHYLVANNQLLPNTIWPTTGYVGADVAKTCVGWYQKTGLAYELNGSIDFSRILLDLDYGLATIQRDRRKHKGSFASADGKYFRIGLGYNFLTPTPAHNQFFIGFRYAKSFFDFQIKSNKLQCNHDSAEDCSKTKKCREAPIIFQNRKDAAIAHWWEVVAGGKVALISILSIGCTARYKFNKKIKNNLYISPFDIPGFGLAEFDHAFGYSVYLALRIPLQKSKNAGYENTKGKSAT